nr:glycosyltransferase [Candidatus Uhrbacteria bacterium]
MKNAKSRIIFVITQAEWGGVQSYCVRAATEAIKRGYEVLIVAGSEGELQGACEKAGIPYQKLLRMEREIRPLKDIGAIRELQSLFREWRPDTVYLHSSKAGIVGSIAGRLARVPHIVYRIGGWSFLDPVSQAQKTLRIWSERLTASCKDVIITLHPDDRARAEEHHIKPKERVVMIPNALDLETFDKNILPHDEAHQELDELWKKGCLLYTS